MSTPSPRPDPNRPTPSRKRHRRESFWQITLPIVLVVVLLGVGFAFVVRSGADGISGVADLSLVLVSLPLLLAGLVILAILAGVVFGLRWLLLNLGQYFRIGQDVSARVAHTTDDAASKVTNAIIPAMAGFSVARHLVESARSGSAPSESDPDRVGPDTPPAGDDIADGDNPNV